MSRSMRDRLMLAFVALVVAAGIPRAALALWTESGDVEITVSDQGSIVPREAFEILPTDTILSIRIGDPGPEGSRDTGTLFISGEGTPEAPREFGTVDLNVGELDLNGVFGTGEITSGTLPDEGTSSMSLQLSEFERITIGRGSFLGCDISAIDELSVRTGGSALLGTPSSSCDLGWLDAWIGSDVEMNGGDLGLAAHNLAGDVDLTGVTAASFQTDVSDGIIDLENVAWTDSQDFDVETIAAPIVFSVRGSTVGAQTSDFIGSAAALRPVHTSLAGNTVWTSAGLVRIWSGGPFDVVLGARLDAGGSLDVSRAGTIVTVGGEGSGSRIDVAGDVLLQFSSVLNVEDGGTVDVDGTLTVGSGTTVNLNGGILRVGVLVQNGTLNENGGLLVVPEASAAASSAAALGAIAWRARRRSA